MSPPFGELYEPKEGCRADELTNPLMEQLKMGAFDTFTSIFRDKRHSDTFADLLVGLIVAS